MMQAELIVREGYGRHMSIAPNGVPFTTLTSGGPKVEGEHMPAGCATPAEAWVAYLGHLAMFTAGASRMWVRTVPEMTEEDGEFNVYSRLAVE